MREYYYPRRLKSVRLEVEQSHKEKAKTVFDKEDNYLEELVKKIVSWRLERVIDNGEFLTEEDYHNLADYVPTNRFKVDISNILMLLDIHGTKEDWDKMFFGWQNNYHNNALRLFLANGIKTNQPCKDMLINNGYSPKKTEWIKNQDVIDYLGSHLGNVRSMELFTSTLKEYGVIPNSRIYLKCLASFFLYCDKAAYKQKGDVAVAQLYSGYNQKEKQLFYKNFLMKNSLDDLCKFQTVYERIRSIFKKKYDKDNFLKMLDTLSKGLANKFLDWENLINLEIGFKGDRDRLNFWKQYALGHKVVNFNDYILYIDFGNYIVTERKLKADGPAYFYEKNYFKDVIEFKIRYYSDTKIKTFQRENFKSYEKSLRENKVTPFIPKIERFPHQPADCGWYWSFEAALRRRNIYKQGSSNWI